MELLFHGKNLKRVFVLKDELQPTKVQKVDEPTDFDRCLISGWKAHQCHLPYDVKEVKTRSEGRFVVQYNRARAETRRKPDEMNSVTGQPFDDAKFNFTKINLDKELIFELNTDNKNDNNRDYVIMNISPLEFGHSLLVPNINEKLPQVVTERSISLAMKCVLSSGLNSLKAAFNSLCAHASVNHLHWHLYYLREPFKLPVESASGIPLGNGCFQVNHSAVGFGFQTNGSNVENTAKRVYAVAKLLGHSNVAHNIFITKGTSFTDQAQQVLKVIVWARTNVAGVKDLLGTNFVVAVCELAGQMLIYNQETYSNLSEEKIVQAHKETCDEAFESVKDAVIGALKGLQLTDETEEVENEEEINLVSSDEEDVEDTIEIEDVVSCESITNGQSSKDILQQIRDNREKLLVDMDDDVEADHQSDQNDDEDYVVMSD